MNNEPDMIDKMNGTEVRMACRELAIDVERKRVRIKELEAALSSSVHADAFLLKRIEELEAEVA